MAKSTECWIVGGIVMTQDERRRVLRANLHLVDGRIARITSSRPARLPKNATVIDVTGQVIPVTGGWLV